MTMIDNMINEIKSLNLKVQEESSDGKGDLDCQIVRYDIKYGMTFLFILANPECRTNQDLGNFRSQLQSYEREVVKIVYSAQELKNEIALINKTKALPMELIVKELGNGSDILNLERERLTLIQRRETKDGLNENTTTLYDLTPLQMDFKVKYHEDYFYFGSLNGQKFSFKFNTLIKEIRNSCFVAKNGASQLNRLFEEFCNLLPDRTENFEDRIGFSPRGWVTPFTELFTFPLDDLQEEIWKNLSNIKFEKDLYQSKERIERLYNSCQMQFKDIVFAHFCIAPLLDSVKDSMNLLHVLSLTGEKESGKTSIVKALNKALGHYKEVLSPDQIKSDSRLEGILCSSTFPMIFDETEKLDVKFQGELKSHTSTEGRMQRKGGGEAGQKLVVNRKKQTPLIFTQNLYCSMYSDSAFRSRVLDISVKPLSRSSLWDEAVEKLEQGDLLKLIYHYTQKWTSNDVLKKMKDQVNRDDKIEKLISIGAEIFEKTVGIKLDLSPLKQLLKASMEITSDEIISLILEQSQFGKPRLRFQSSMNGTLDEFGEDQTEYEFTPYSWIRTPISRYFDSDVEYVALTISNVRELQARYESSLTKWTLNSFYLMIKPYIVGVKEGRVYLESFNGHKYQNSRTRAVLIPKKALENYENTKDLIGDVSGNIRRILVEENNLRAIDIRDKLRILSINIEIDEINKFLDKLIESNIIKANGNRYSLNL